VAIFLFPLEQNNRTVEENPYILKLECSDFAKYQVVFIY